MSDPKEHEGQLDDSALEEVSGGDHDGGTPIDFPAGPETVHYP